MPSDDPSPLTGRLVAALVALAIVLGLAAYGALTWRAVQREEANRMRTVLTLTQRATDSYFTQLEAGLHGLALDLQDGAGLTDLAHVEAQLQRFQRLHSEFVAVNLLQTNGEVIATAYSARIAAVPRISKVHGPSFEQFREHSEGATPLDLGRPLYGRLSKLWFFPMRYVLRGAGGEPVAFLSAAMPVDLLQQFWSSAPVVAQASLGLVRDDGYLISLFPAPEGASRDRVYGMPLMAERPWRAAAGGASDAGYAQGRLPGGDTKAAYAYGRLQHYPVTMFVATPLAVMHSAWWDAVRVPLALTLLLALGAAFGWRLLRGRQRAWDREHRRAEAAEAEKRLAEGASRTKSEFMARMSHELRTPLNAILGFTQVLLRDESRSLQAQQRQELRHVLHAGHHLLSLIDDLLDVARVEAGTLRLQPAAVDVLDLVRDAIRQVDVAARARGITLALEPCDEQPPAALADRTRLRQVVLNLLSNAVKYNRPSGRVIVAVGEHAGRLRLRVRDTGAGLNDRQLAQMFQPFNRLGHESSDIPGTGIGLVITRNLVELMSGKIAVTSQLGVGSEFVVELPLARREAEAGPATMPGALDEASPSAGGLIVYIDDDEINRLLMQACIALRPGLQLRLAAGGAEGLALVRACRPDAVLIDLMMPGMSGMDVLRALRDDATLARLPCIAVSANAMPEEIDAALRAGFDAYVVKPLSIDVLLHEIDRFVVQPAP